MKFCKFDLCSAGVFFFAMAPCLQGVVEWSVLYFYVWSATNNHCNLQSTSAMWEKSAIELIPKATTLHFCTLINWLLTTNGLLPSVQLIPASK